eukprot:CAMPEP_0116005614 /NCGR_PEP_ID=MMETSP0321-20121206/1263_1 /TAXON_ID=163516 /ORGANISM="Leptocylindrus danicus var. danicus, Strain B650" /LENGTH=724 /DNA_ID=CAMNT_0003474061 /DNA_START=48 /DNA_END=2219 /DNA_ORIENTATION=+
MGFLEDLEEVIDNLKPAPDASTNAVAFTAVLNGIFFVVMMLTYDGLRFLLPSIYADRQRQVGSERMAVPIRLNEHWIPFSWVWTVLEISWEQLQGVGLDAYFFLRFIQLCFWLTAVPAFWAIIILWPVYATAGGGKEGFYKPSLANVDQASWRLWFPPVFMWGLTLYAKFTIAKEYEQYIKLRMDFLGSKERRCIKNQRYYSLLIEKIPDALRSDKALYDYFDNIFPGQVHSAYVMLDLSELEKLSAKRLRTVANLEGALAYFHATGKIPWKRIRRRIKCNAWHSDFDYEMINAIDYFRCILRGENEEMARLQYEKQVIAENGGGLRSARSWIERSSIYNGSKIHHTLDTELNRNIVAHMKIDVKGDEEESFTLAREREGRACSTCNDEACNENLMTNCIDIGENHFFYEEPSQGICNNDENVATGNMKQLGSKCNILRKCVGHFGLDMLIAFFSRAQQDIDIVVDTVSGTYLASTGFLTLRDLVSVTTAVSTPICHLPNTIEVAMASEPQDIVWQNIHIHKDITSKTRALANAMIALGAILWSIPVALIQVYASADYLGTLSGMKWILTVHDGRFATFLNGYLPVLALLVLIMLLPVIFQQLSLRYERRKSYSEIQKSILRRFFLFQLSNIYVTVTAGSVWRSLGDIVENPSKGFQYFGAVFPTMVGYFISFLIVKILGGLPMVLLRLGAVLRLAFLNMLCGKRKTQRQVDNVYKKQELLYGW